MHFCLIMLFCLAFLHWSLAAVSFKKIIVPGYFISNRASPVGHSLCFKPLRTIIHLGGGGRRDLGIKIFGFQGPFLSWICCLLCVYTFFCPGSFQILSAELVLQVPRNSRVWGAYRNSIAQTKAKENHRQFNQVKYAEVVGFLLNVDSLYLPGDTFSLGHWWALWCPETVRLAPKI